MYQLWRENFANAHGYGNNYLVASLGLIAISWCLRWPALLLFIKQFYRFRAAISSLISRLWLRETRKI